MCGIAAIFVVVLCPIHGAMMALLRQRVDWFAKHGCGGAWRGGEAAGGVLERTGIVIFVRMAAKSK